MTATLYDPEEWAAATTRGRRVFNHNYSMLGNELRGWELVNTVTTEPEPGAREQIYIWQKKGSEGEELIRVGITEQSSWRGAQQQLQGQLNHSMRPDIPKCAGKLAKIGDVSFAGQEPESKEFGMITFTRGNVFVSLSSVGDTPVDVSSVAGKLDRALNERPKSTELKRGLAADASPKPLSVKGTKSTTLIEKLPELAARGKWLKIIAPDGELVREDDNLIYLPSEGGRKRVEEYVMPQ